MRSSESGTATSVLEVTNISQHGFWLFHDGQEYFLPYADYPWFRDATVAKICKVEDHGRGHFYWPDLRNGVFFPLPRLQPHSQIQPAVRIDPVYDLVQDLPFLGHVAGRGNEDANDTD